MKNSVQTMQAGLLRRMPPKKPQRETAAEERAEDPAMETLESPEYERREHGGKAPQRKPRYAGGRP